MSLLLSLLLTTSTYVETLHDGWGQVFTVDEILYEEKTACFSSIVFENRLFGRVFALDGIIQNTEKDEPFYSEMIAHVPLFSHPSPKKVLVIGGGDGGAIREVLRHPSVEAVTLVEIDGEVINFCKKFFPKISNGAFEDKKVTVIIEDGTPFIEYTSELFDVIIVDGTDPIGPGRALYEAAFFKACAAHLNEKGIFVNHNSIPFLQKEGLNLSNKHLREAFPFVTFFHSCIPTYVGGSMVFSFASKDDNFKQIQLKELETRIKQIDGLFEVYNPEYHLASFALPNYLKVLLKEMN